MLIEDVDTSSEEEEEDDTLAFMCMDEDEDLDDEDRLLQRTILRNFMGRAQKTKLTDAGIQHRIRHDTDDDLYG